MDRPVLMGIVLVVLVGLLALMYLGWRGRQRRQSGLPKTQPVPADRGADLISTEVFYVATTMANEPLNRVAVSGLGYRARASVTVSERGVILAIPGEADAFIPAAHLRGVDRATWTIDRVVEKGGLIVLAWNLTADDTTVAVDSYLRLADGSTEAALVSAMRELLRTPQPQNPVHTPIPTHTQIPMHTQGHQGDIE
ncbi:MAG: hypothetical protein JWP30_882 [Homoserinimonas sp.]|jgi:hypothetical protein|nr:hypothetical protein [Homoserinimonas sp.]